MSGHRPKGNTREFRNLANIAETASTSRILNLAYVHHHANEEPEYKKQPFFQHPTLNKAILVKHTLRPNELEAFTRDRRTATKVILPFDSTDLRLGGGALFVDQVGFERILREVCGGSAMDIQSDLRILKMIDALPSLDPFILKECLARQGVHPAGCYFVISKSDIASMMSFANDEIDKLVRIAFGDSQSTASMQFASKILSDNVDSELDPLRATLRLNSSEFSEGLFSWRGFLYFKWRYIALREELGRVIEGLAKYQPRGFTDADLKEYITTARPRIAKDIMATLASVGKILENYDSAFAALTKDLNPTPFRTFLINGPAMFFELGENVGVLSHIASFWSYRMGGSRTHRLSLLEFAELLIDFEESLACVFVDR
ncbi:hypothetical protein [Asticcacaulis sp. 201]|uniref:hypothetical protein n=1 Tax=Asticcacaulis sp. 201 TaxID=3028787 RepID=UPI002916185F|nr:hypothetical protein [Asticcacaulis sp. 201]MDV6330945.1 hypothetical protein [Asticcacaulis sp. 201]